MRGRLIMPFAAELARLDTAAMASGSPPGYDPDFEEPIRVDTRGDGIGAPVRRELPPVRVRCQVEPQLDEDQVLGPAGNAPQSRLGLIFHFRDLERQALVDTATGDALLRPGDRLVAIYDLQDRPVQVVRTPPGLYITEARALGFGLSRRRPRRNLLLCVFEDRPQGSRRS
jgi:hypothetical protein